MAPTYAKRFAAKEAAAKALGTGFSRGVFHSDLGVENLPSGQPTLRLTGGALARLARPYATGAAAPGADTDDDRRIPLCLRAWCDLDGAVTPDQRSLP